MAPAKRERHPAVRPEHLNKTGKRRVREGVRCFLYPQSAGQFTAICVDWGLHARGRNAVEAKAELHRVIADTVEVAYDAGTLEDLFNGPDNRAARSWYLRTLAAYAIVRAVLTVIRLLDSNRPPIDRYRETPELCPA